MRLLGLFIKVVNPFFFTKKFQTHKKHKTHIRKQKRQHFYALKKCPKRK